MSKYQSFDPEKLAEMFGALANPHRVKIYQQLLASAAKAGCCGSDPCTVVIEMRVTVGDVKGELEIAASTVSHHLKELRQAGLIKMGRCGRNVSCCMDLSAARELAGFFMQVAGTAVSEIEGKVGSDKGGAE